MHSINVAAGRHHWLNLSCVATVAFVLVASSVGIAQDNKPQLPPEFKVPRPIPEFLKDQDGDERTNAEAIQEWQKTIRPYLALALAAKTLPEKIPGTQLTAGKLIEESCRIRVQKLSQKSLRGQLKTTRVEVYRDVHLTAKVKEVREFAMKTIVDEAEKLMSGHLVVRLQAVQLLSELVIADADEKKKTPAYLYAESLPVLIKIMTDKKQPEAVHILAAAGIEKILRESNLPTTTPSKLRSDAALALIAELKSPGLSTWYQQVLVMALPSVGLTTIPNASGIQEPAMALLLMEIIGDPKRSLKVRCKAVLALGKCPLPNAGLKAEAISKSILELTYEVSVAYNKQEVTPVSGALLLQDIYYGLAGDKALVITGLRHSPLGAIKDIQDAYKAVVPLLRHALKNINAPQIVPLLKDVVGPVEQLIGPNAVKALTTPK